MNWQLRIKTADGGSSLIFSRKPTTRECEWIVAGYSGDSYTLSPCPDSYAANDGVLAKVAANIRASDRKASAK